MSKKKSVVVCYITAFTIMMCVYCNLYRIIGYYLADEVVIASEKVYLFVHGILLIEIVVWSFWRFGVFRLAEAIAKTIKENVSFGKTCEHSQENDGMQKSDIDWKSAVRVGNAKGFACFLLVILVAVITYGLYTSIMYMIASSLIAGVIGTIYFTAKEIREQKTTIDVRDNLNSTENAIKRSNRVKSVAKVILIVALLVLWFFACHEQYV